MSYTTERVTVGDTQLMVLRGGAGRALLVLHGIEGHEGWLDFHERLSASHTVLAPSHPGYGQTAAPEWITSIAHQAVFYNWYLQTIGAQDVDLVGVGIGGWMAAQMAIMCGARLRHLVLVDAAGLKPRASEPLDVFVTPWREVLEGGFHNPSGSTEYTRLYASGIPDYGGAREAGRTMSIRMCFKPYMHDPSLLGMLGKIETPTLVVWGRDDRITPVECAEQFQQSIPGARLHIVEECGHLAHLEQPARLTEIVNSFCAGGAS